MTIERNPNGSLVLSDIVNGYLFTRVYYGYTKKEARALFAQEIKNGGAR